MRYVHDPLGFVSFYGDNADKFIENYDPRSSLEENVVAGVMASLAGQINDYRATQDALLKLRREIAREKYEVRARISQQLGVDLPLVDDGCPVITLVKPNGLGSSIKLEVGDVLISYNGKSLTGETMTKDVLGPAVAAASPDRKVRVRIRRDGKRMSGSVSGGKLLGINFCVSPANVEPAWTQRGVPASVFSTYPFRKLGEPLGSFMGF
ncbi:hypothetical protein CA12_06970 [Alienimonas californiensis]|uniref:PDZ domain-containing protein n=2 Tax=Alienimonas californiensis TaxID=2527989 RepID=A0A517P5I4_9PLAN|nr:hypothetical protein CA12_06970 [Alienimonas californiensis]